RTRRLVVGARSRQQSHRRLRPPAPRRQDRHRPATLRPRGRRGPRGRPARDRATGRGGRARRRRPPRPRGGKPQRRLAPRPDGAVYFAPLVRDEIRKYAPNGALRWTTKRGLFARESDPEFLPPRGREVQVRHALVNVALALGPPPDGRLYVLGSDDSAASKLRVDVLDTATGTILATRRLAPRETAVAVDARGSIAAFDADSLLRGASAAGREAFEPAFALPDLTGDTVTLDRLARQVTLVTVWA